MQNNKTPSFNISSVPSQIKGRIYLLFFSSTWTKNFQMYKLVSRDRGTRDHIANTLWIMDKAKEFQKNIYYCFIYYTKAFDCVDHNKLWKMLIRDGKTKQSYLSPRNLYAGQETTVRSRKGTINWFKIWKGVRQIVYYHLALFNLYSEYSMKCWAGWITSWNQNCQEKYQELQTCKLYHSNGRKWKGTKDPLDEGKRKEWKS